MISSEVPFKLPTSKVSQMKIQNYVGAIVRFYKTYNQI